MTNLINNFGAALSNTVLFAVTVAMAGLGFAVLGTLALFAVLAIGVAMIASPFVAKQQPVEADDVA